MLYPYGNNIKLYIEGGSHDERIEMILSGFPKGVKIDYEFLYEFMARRAPGQNKWSTSRKEADKPVFLSGITDGVTDGNDIHAVIYNTNQNSRAYNDAGLIPRPSHADYCAVMKYGRDTDLRGGGHYSGRLTALLCIAGALSMMFLKEKGIEIFAHIRNIGNVKDTPFDKVNVSINEKELIKENGFPVINRESGEKMISLIEEIKADENSVGGAIECCALNLPIGLGEHLFAGAEARISSAMFSIPAVKAVEFGNGFDCSALTGSQNNDAFYFDENYKIRTKTNNCGGILGGMTNSMPLICSIALKPTPSIAKEQDTVNLDEKKNIKYKINGRHDPCIVPRAVPVAEAAMAVAILDMILDEVQK